MHRFLIRIYELVRRYGFYIGVLPSLIALILPENYFYISIPILLFAILLDSLSFYYGRIPEGLAEKRRAIAKATVYGICTTIALLAALPFGGIPFASGDFRAVRPGSPVDIPRNFLRKECSSQTGSL